uniref:Decapping nuclease n=1 Tax=Caenorhabditis tropicalis TaxID=1561998 RepID=A0A1I7UYR0_9PELO
MSYMRGRFTYDRPIGFEAKMIDGINLEYTTDDNEVTPGEDGRPILEEEMIERKNFEIDVMEGYDPRVDSATNKHSIYHLYEYESKTKFLDLIPRIQQENFNEIDTRFLCCRYVICEIDDWMIKGKPAELLAIRTDGNIYIGANKSLDSFFPNETAKEAAFGGLNFAKKVTKEVDPHFTKHHSVVRQWHVKNMRTHKSMTIFISSVARAFDSNGNVVELKTTGESVVGKLQNLQGNKARNWWLRALLSGANRIVYGVRQKNLNINEIYEASLDDFTNGHFKFTESRLFSEVFKIFDRISKTLAADGSVCSVTLNRAEPMRVKLESMDYTKRSSFW